MAALGCGHSALRTQLVAASRASSDALPRARRARCCSSRGDRRESAARSGLHLSHASSHVLRPLRDVLAAAALVAAPAALAAQQAALPGYGAAAAARQRAVEADAVRRPSAE